jgi:hypothetical protein
MQKELWKAEFFFAKNHYGYQKTQNFMLISNSLMSALKNASIKSYRQINMQILSIFWNIFLEVF